jgi:hypothetical protein
MNFFFGKKPTPPPPPPPAPPPPLPTDIDNLVALIPGLTPDIADIYLKSNNGNFEKALAELLETHASSSPKQRSPPKPPSSSRDQPSSSRDQPSSSRDQPSSSTGFNSGDFMDGEIDLNDPRFKENVEKDVKIIDFDTWLNTMFYSEGSQKVKNVRNKLARLFGKNNWDVIDPKGDGFCGLYAASIDYASGTNTVISRDTIIDSIVQGLEEYYKARKLHIAMGIPLPNELKTPEFWMEFGGLGDAMMITEENIKTETNKRALRERFEILKTLANIPGEAFTLLAYAYARNFLILNYDKDSSRPYVLSWIPCYSGVYIDNGEIVYPRELAISIMFKTGHYFLFHNDIQLKKEAVARTLQGEWQAMTGARGLRKSRKSRALKYKNKSRKAIAITKMKKPKYSNKKRRQPKKRTKKY